MTEVQFLRRKIQILVDLLCSKGVITPEELPEHFFDEDLVDEKHYRCPFCNKVGTMDEWEYEIAKPYCGESCRWNAGC